MSNNIFLKFIIVAALTLILIIPLALINNKVDERQRYSRDAQREISEFWTGKQVVQGPLLIVPYTEKTITRKWNKELKKYEPKETTRHHRLEFFPKDLNVLVEVETEERYRGIYSAPVYTANLTLRGHFRIPKNYNVSTSRSIQWWKAFITIGVDDARGIRTGTEVTWNEVASEIFPGSNVNYFDQGFHAKVGNLYRSNPKRYDFEIGLRLAGTQQLSFLPVADDTHVSLSSSWPHPSFTGRFPPQSREITDHGFKANWEISHFSTNIKHKISSCEKTPCNNIRNSQFGVSFFKPIDVYSLTDRALKYALLFIILTFSVFFLFEILKSLRIHPVQYGFVGVAQAVFYLLLISLSEHISFNYAYLLSALSSITLIGCYTAHILQSVGRALGFSLTLSVLYGKLLIILKSEDYALLMGALLIFLVLSLLMLITRNIDWYQINTARKTNKRADHE